MLSSLREIDILEEIIKRIKTDIHIPEYILSCYQMTGLTDFSGKGFWYNSCTYTWIHIEQKIWRS